MAALARRSLFAPMRPLRHQMTLSRAAPALAWREQGRASALSDLPAMRDGKVLLPGDLPLVPTLAPIPTPPYSPPPLRELSEEEKQRLSNVLFLSEKELDGASPLVRASISLENASQQQLNKVKIREMILRFQRKPGDTGSPEVQIAVLTHRVRNLERHMAEFKKDHFMRRRLEQLRGKQRRMLRYLERTDYERFKFVAHHLSLNLPLPATRENLKIIRAQRKEQRKLEEEKRLASDMSKKEIRAEERRKILDKQIAYIASRKKP